MSINREDLTKFVDKLQDEKNENYSMIKEFYPRKQNSLSDQQIAVKIEKDNNRTAVFSTDENFTLKNYRDSNKTSLINDYMQGNATGADIRLAFKCFIGQSVNLTKNGTADFIYRGFDNTLCGVSIEKLKLTNNDAYFMVIKEDSLGNNPSYHILMSDDYYKQCKKETVFDFFKNKISDIKYDEIPEKYIHKFIGNKNLVYFFDDFFKNKDKNNFLDKIILENNKDEGLLTIQKIRDTARNCGNQVTTNEKLNAKLKELININIDNKFLKTHMNEISKILNNKESFVNKKEHIDEKLYNLIAEFRKKYLDKEESDLLREMSIEDKIEFINKIIPEIVHRDQQFVCLEFSASKLKNLCEKSKNTPQTQVYLKSIFQAAGDSKKIENQIINDDSRTPILTDEKDPKFRLKSYSMDEEARNNYSQGMVSGRHLLQWALEVTYYTDMTNNGKVAIDDKNYEVENKQTCEFMYKDTKGKACGFSLSGYFSKNKDLPDYNLMCCAIDSLGKDPQYKVLIDKNTFDKFKAVKEVNEIFKTAKSKTVIDYKDLKEKFINKYIDNDRAKKILSSPDPTVKNLNIIKENLRMPPEEIINDNVLLKNSMFSNKQEIDDTEKNITENKNIP